jgi:signal peptidase I
MPEDDWWTRAVDEFGLDTSVDVSPPLAADHVAAVEAPAGRHRRRRRRRRRSAVDWLIVAVVAIGAAVVVRLLVVQQFSVEGDSMLGTLHSGDRVMVNKLSYRFHDPSHGDVVVLEDSDSALETRDLIKRVVGLPGETVEYRDCVLRVNGRQVDEAYLDPQLVQPGHCGDAQSAVQVEPGHIFVMGDNRDASLDSRTAAIGQIPLSHVVGRAFMVVWPSSDWRWL